jgi:eukaryotic-like serine/threonine-protein kinase
MGTVWLGTDEVLGRPVALKRLGAPDSPAGARAEREARLAARLSHPHLVAVFDLAIDGEDQWLVMEYVEGPTLAALVADRGPLTPDEAAPLIAQVADALAAAHEAGIVHRDVKPSNVLIDPEGQAKLTDFGVARSTEADATLTQTGFVTGSPAYLSPELASGGRVTPATDVWSLGATLFHALTGRPPYDVGDNVVGALYRIVHEEPPRAENAGWLAPLLAGAMTRDPARRWTLDHVRAFLAGEPETATQAMPTVAALAPVAPPPARAGRARRLPRPPGPRSPWLWPAIAAVVVVAAIAIGLIASKVWVDHNSPARAGAGTPSRTPSPSPSTGPTEDGIRSFVSAYLSAASADPGRGFTMLTADYQRASGGLAGYERFWGKVTKVHDVTDIAPSLDPLEVSYRYTYTLRGTGKRTEEVHLDLVYDDGHYLISGGS